MHAIPFRRNEPTCHKCLELIKSNVFRICFATSSFNEFWWVAHFSLKSKLTNDPRHIWSINCFAITWDRLEEHFQETLFGLKTFLLDELLVFDNLSWRESLAVIVTDCFKEALYLTCFFNVSEWSEALDNFLDIHWDAFAFLFAELVEIPFVFEVVEGLV